MCDIVSETVQLYRRKRILQMHLIRCRAHKPLSMVFLVVVNRRDGKGLISTCEVIICLYGHTEKEHGQWIGFLSCRQGRCEDVIRDFKHGHDSADMAMGGGKVAACQGQPGKERDRDHMRVIEFDFSYGSLNLWDDLLKVSPDLEICGTAHRLLYDGR